MLTILSGVCIFLIITLFLVMILLLAKKYLVHSGKVKITINNDTVVGSRLRQSSALNTR